MLKDKKAIITGSNRGIGRAVLEVFAENGAEVFAHSRVKTDSFNKLCAELSKKHKTRIIPVYFDLLDDSQVKDGFRTIFKETKSIDILVNNAGIVSENKMFQMTPIDVMKDVFEINFFAAMSITQLTLKKMTRQKSGNIINVSSIAGLDFPYSQLEYIGAKAALIGATKKLALELGSSGIRVNAVAPGFIDTDMLDSYDDEIINDLLSRVIMKRKGLPREVANTVLYLASEMSSYVTGQTIKVDGGIF